MAHTTNRPQQNQKNVHCDCLTRRLSFNKYALLHRPKGHLSLHDSSIFPNGCMRFPHNCPYLSELGSNQAQIVSVSSIGLVPFGRSAWTLLHIRNSANLEYVTETKGANSYCTDCVSIGINTYVYISVLCLCIQTYSRIDRHHSLFGESMFVGQNTRQNNDSAHKYRLAYGYS